MSDRSSSDVRNTVNQHFDYLFQYGFRIDSEKYFPQQMGSWIATLLSDKAAIRIVDDRGDIVLSFSSVKMDKWFDLATVVYYITHGEELLEAPEGDLEGSDEQLVNAADILKEYIDRIVEVFQDIKKHEGKLLEARKTVRSLQLEKRSSDNKL